MLLQFKDLDGSPIYINPEHVVVVARVVSAKEAQITTLACIITVLGSVALVSEQIKIAMSELEIVRSFRSK